MEYDDNISNIVKYRDLAHESHVSGTAKLSTRGHRLWSPASLSMGSGHRSGRSGTITGVALVDYNRYYSTVQDIT